MTATGGNRWFHQQRFWFALALAIYLASCLHFALSLGENIPDDAYISYRYAANLLDGRGLVYNPGVPVEGYTSFLWIILHLPFMALGIPPHLVSQALGTLCGAITLWLVHRDLRYLFPSSHLVPAASSLLLAGSRTFVAWSVAGLETPLFTLATYLAFSFLFFSPVVPRWGLAAGIALLTRPEGGLWFVLLLGTALVMAASGERPARWVFGGALAFLSVALPHELFRIVYYGDFLPNTFHAKVHGLAIARGAHYLLLMARENLLWILAPLALLGLGRELRVGIRARGLFLCAATVSWTTYLLLIGGDYFEFRFLHPLLPLLIPAAVSGIVVIGGATRQAWRIPVTAGALGLAAVAIALPVIAPYRGDTWVTALEREVEYSRRFFLAGRWLARSIRPGDSLAVQPAGIIPYVTGAPTLDLLGLNDREIARSGRRVAGPAGHEILTTPDEAIRRGITYWVDHPDIEWRPIAYTNWANVRLTTSPPRYFHFRVLDPKAVFKNGWANYAPSNWITRVDLYE